MSTLDDLKHLPTPAPVGFNPGIEWDGTTGHLTMATKGEQPNPEKINQVLDSSPFLDSQSIEVDWSSRPKVSIQHDDAGNLRQVWYKLTLRPKRDSVDVQELIDRIYDDVEPVSTDGDVWRTIQVGDTHIGKSGIDGGGAEVLIDRWKQSVTNALELGGYDHVHLAFMGDLIEGEVSQGGKNIANNDLSLTTALRITRNLVTWTVQQALDYGGKVIVSTVPGNHGETTRLQNRPLTDSHDVDIVASVQQAFDTFDAGERVDWYYPGAGQGHLVYRVGDTIFTSSHGHLFKGMLRGAENWWAGMSASGAPAGAATILMAGHYHSPLVANYTRSKWICFGGALEDKSTWLNEQTGTTSQPGMLTYLTELGTPTEFTIV